MLIVHISSTPSFFSQEFQTSTLENAQHGGIQSEPRWKEVTRTGPGRNASSQLLPGIVLYIRQSRFNGDIADTAAYSYLILRFQPVEKSSFTITVAIEGVIHNVYVIKRPGCDEFMRKLAEHYEVKFTFC